MRRRTKSEQPNLFPWLHSSYSQASKSDDASAEKRRGMQIIHFEWKWKQEIAACNSVFGIATINRIAGKGRTVAQILQAAPAIWTISIHPTDPGNSDASAYREFG